MPGSHRAVSEPRTWGLPGWAYGAALVLLVLVVAWFGSRSLLGADDSEPLADPRPTPSVTPSGPASPTPTATASPEPPATAPPGLPELSADQPRRLVIDGILDVGFDAAVNPEGDNLEAASSSEVSRWADRGSPGSPGEDTVVVVGRANALEGSAFTELPTVSTGNEVTIRTDQGKLTYTVRTRRDVQVEGMLDDPALARRQPGRLVLVAEKYAASGDRLATNLVVVAELTAVEPG